MPKVNVSAVKEAEAFVTSQLFYVWKYECSTMQAPPVEKKNAKDEAAEDKNASALPPANPLSPPFTAPGSSFRFAGIGSLTVPEYTCEWELVHKSYNERALCQNCSKTGAKMYCFSDGVQGTHACMCCVDFANHHLCPQERCVPTVAGCFRCCHRAVSPTGACGAAP
jgi:hypothetical protein